MTSSKRNSATDLSTDWERLQSEFLNWAADLSSTVKQRIARHRHAVLPGEAVENLQDELHKLKGAAGLAGYPEIAKAAGEIQSALAGRACVNEAWRKSRALHEMISTSLEGCKRAEAARSPESGTLQGQERPPISGTASHDAKVLVVCASTTIFHMISCCLDSLSCTVQMATGADEGFRMYRQSIPEVVLICSVLANEEGMTLANRIATYEKGSAARIVYLTAGEVAETRGLHDSVEVVCVDNQGRSRLLRAVERRLRDSGMTAAS